MREMIAEKVERIEAHHERLKTRRYGWLVRPVILTVGIVVTIVGIITIPLPGQGWLTTFLGIAILSLEARWARAILEFGVSSYDGFFQWYSRQSRLVRWLLILAGIGLVFGTFFFIAWLMWFMGTADMLTFFFEGQLGWSR